MGLICILPLSSFVTLRKLLNFAELQFIHLQNGDDNSYCIVLHAGRIKRGNIHANPWHGSVWYLRSIKKIVSVLTYFAGKTGTLVILRNVSKLLTVRF